MPIAFSLSILSYSVLKFSAFGAVAGLFIFANVSPAISSPFEVSTAMELFNIENQQYLKRNIPIPFPYWTNKNCRPSDTGLQFALSHYYSSLFFNSPIYINQGKKPYFKPLYKAPSNTLLGSWLNSHIAAPPRPWDLIY